jgi:hypothetical protein
MVTIHPPPFISLRNSVSATPLFRLFPISPSKTHTSFVPLSHDIETLLAIIENQKQTIARLGLTSRNSSFPPSHDIIKPVSLRQKTGRKAGGQKNV